MKGLTIGDALGILFVWAAAFAFAWFIVAKAIVLVEGVAGADVLGMRFMSMAVLALGAGYLSRLIIRRGKD